MTKSALSFAAVLAAISSLLSATSAVAAPGDLDAPFNPSVNLPVYAIALQPDGKIIIGGDFDSVGGTPRNGIARINADGTLDTTFNPGTGANDWVYAAVLQADGKVIIGGDFTTVNGTSRGRVARLNADGTLDASFDPGTGVNDTIRTMSLQADGKVIIGGVFTTVNGTGRNRIARLDSDGSLDTTFDPGTGPNNHVYGTALQADGKVIIGGWFTSVDGTARIRIARLDADGDLDTAFNPGTGANDTVRATVVQADGKVFIGGFFTTVNGTSRNRVARLNADGSVDTTFDPGTGADGSIRSASLQSDGKIIIGGEFTTVGGATRNRIARLNTNGAVDIAFDPGSGANFAVRSTAVQSDGKVLIGGDFFFVGGTNRNRLARLEGGAGPGPLTQANPPTIRLKGKKKITTSRGRLTIRGTASDPDGDLASVRFRDSRKNGSRWRPARGTSAWKAVAVLKPGRNSIQIQAFDSINAGSKIQRVVVMRK